MRLIDADAFLERFEAMCETKTDNAIAMVLRGALDDEPAAYNVDKVVEKLEEKANTEGLDCEEYEDEIKMQCYRDAIEIVKGGGVNG